MELENDFTVPVPRAQAWAVLMDVERIAPCMPGATFDGYLEDAQDSGFKGRVKVKLGPDHGDVQRHGPVRRAGRGRRASP